VSLIHNERTKLTATFMNAVAATMVGVGAVAPLVAFTYGIPGAVAGSTLALIGLGWLAGGVILHLLARVLLRRLRE
jgi:small-conductance mechanosensitive channel